MLRFTITRPEDKVSLLTTSDLNVEINRRLDEIENNYSKNNDLKSLYFVNSMIISSISLAIHGKPPVKIEEILQRASTDKNNYSGLSSLILFMMNQEIGLLNIKELIFMWNGDIFNRMMVEDKNKGVNYNE